MNSLMKYISGNKYTLAFGACFGLVGVLVFHQLAQARQAPIYVMASKKSETPTAECRDGTTSYSMRRSGTCAGHGGVLKWSEK